MEENWFHFKQQHYDKFLSIMVFMAGIEPFDKSQMLLFLAID